MAAVRPLLMICNTQERNNQCCLIIIILTVIRFGQLEKILKTSIKVKAISKHVSVVNA